MKSEKLSQIEAFLIGTNVDWEIVEDIYIVIYFGVNDIIVTENCINNSYVGFDNVINIIEKIKEFIVKQEDELDFFVSCLLSNTLEN